jgi:hypothetical protein
VVCVLAVVCGFGAGVSARVLASPEQVLSEAYPGSEVVQDSVFLTEAQRREAALLAGARIEPELLHRFTVRRDGRRVAVAYADAHRVRTLPETLLVVVDGSNRVGRVEVLVFREPLEYLPDPRWYGQMHGRGLDDGLRLKAGIDGITGATLSTRAAVTAVRRVLALHAVLSGDPDP